MELLRMEDFLSSPILWIIIAAASEIVALTPLKSNSIVQLLLQALYAIKPAKRTDPTGRQMALAILFEIFVRRCRPSYPSGEVPQSNRRTDRCRSGSRL